MRYARDTGRLGSCADAATTDVVPATVSFGMLWLSFGWELWFLVDFAVWGVRFGFWDFGCVESTGFWCWGLSLSLEMCGLEPVGL